MTSPTRLTLAFVNKRPAAAARVLASLPVEDAAAFVDSVPTRYAAKVLLPLRTSTAGAIVERLTIATGAALLRELEFVAAKAILRHVSSEARAGFFSEMPDDTRRDFEDGLAYPAATVGAQMSNTVITVLENETVADALKRIRDDRDGRSDVVFVTDDRRRLLGSVRLSVLARRSPKTPIAELIDQSCAPVPARAGTADVASMPVWESHRQLPVVSREGELLGTIYRDALAPGERAEAPDGTIPSAAASVVGMLAASTPALFDLVTPPQSGTSGESE